MKILLWTLLLLHTSFSAFFGQNKVQYQSSDWRRIQTSHFDIYFNQEGDSLGQYTAQHIEPIYENLQEKLGHKLFRRVPIILHNSPNHFQETNVIRIPLPEAVGGFTEIFKNRIVLPFAGSWTQYHHVLTHELVHAMMFDLFRGPSGGGLSIARRMSSIPLWFSEGLAEWASNHWDVEGEFYLIDAVTSGYVPLPTYEFPGYLAYKGGHSFLLFIEDNFGEKAVRKLIAQLLRGRSINDAFKEVTSISLEELGELWIRELRKKYWPELGTRQYAKELATPLTHHKEDQSYFNAAPSLSPDGKSIAWASDRGSWEGIFLRDLKTKETEQLVKNGFVSSHESLHLLSSGFTWSPDSKHLAFVSQSGGRDVLHVYDVKEDKLLLEIDPGFHVIRHPSYSPDGKSLLFSAQNAYQTDLYSYHLETQVLTQHTNDPWIQEHPIFGKEAKTLYYSTNRYQSDDKRNQEKRDLVQLDLESRQEKRLIHSRWSSTHPVLINEGTQLAYLSNESGLKNIKLLDLKSGQSSPVTNVLSSIQSFSYSPTSGQVAFSLFEGGGWNVFLIDSTHFKPLKEIPQPTQFITWTEAGEKSPWFPPINSEVLLSYQSIKEENSEKKKEDSLHIAELDSTELLRRAENDSLRSADSVKFVQELYADTTNEFYPVQSQENKGPFPSTPYDSEWSLDNASAAAGVGVASGNNVAFGGQAALNFSDLMGDQELAIQIFGSGTSFEDIQAYVKYGYLKHQIDYHIYGFHNVQMYSEDPIFTPELKYIKGDRWVDSAQVVESAQIWLDPKGNPIDTVKSPSCLLFEGADSLLVPYSPKKNLCYGTEYFKDRVAGIGNHFSRPYSRFARFDLNLEYQRVFRAKYIRADDGILEEQIGQEVRTLDRLRSELDWTFDNSRWNSVGPANGGRYGLGILLENNLSSDEHYLVGKADFRHYLFFFKKFSFVSRFSAGASAPLNTEEQPTRFLMGGDQLLTFVARSNENNSEGTFESRYSGELVTPLRGFYYYDLIGTRMSLLNLEFRFPFVHQSYIQLPVPFPAVIPIRNIYGVLFTDIGTTWDEHSSPWSGFGQGYGWGLRANLGIFVLRYTKAWTNGALPKYRASGRSYWSIGAEF